MAPAHRLLDARQGQLVLERLELATSFWQRFRGLQFRRPLDAGHGLWLEPCTSIHTCWLRFPLDVAFLDARGTVLAVQRQVPPWRIRLAPPGTRAVLETTAGQLPQSLKTGDRLQVVPGLTE